jgi:hypothetical protein
MLSTTPLGRGVAIHFHTMTFIGEVSNTLIEYDMKTTIVISSQDQEGIGRYASSGFPRTIVLV